MASAALLIVAVSGPVPARAGHELSYYPAFYPSDITVTTMDPAAAGAALGSNKAHAYLGESPVFSGKVPAQLQAVESLSGYVVLDFNPASKRFNTPQRRCQAAAGLASALSKGVPAFLADPYPITSFDGDYLAHADRAEQAKRSVSKAAPNRKLAIRASGVWAAALQKAGYPTAEAAWDAELVQVPIEALMEADRTNGTVGPPWIKEGWFHAWRLLADHQGRGTAGVPKDAHKLFERLTRGDYPDQVAHYNLERRLVGKLMQPCVRAVVGHTIRREYYNDEYSFGVENVAWDGQLGMNSPVFVRTVKLKDYPWNGPIFLGLNSRFGAAWNPVAGFNDPGGRLVWSIVADDAFMMMPGSASWIPNRVDAGSSILPSRPGGYEIPPNAVLPEAGTGILKPVGPGKRSSSKILYRILASPYQDGSEMEMADALYPFVFAYRWAGVAGGPSDPVVAAATALMRERIAGILPLHTEKRIDLISDLQIPRWVITVELYVNDGSDDPRQVASLAPPWSAIPWELGTLMEEAVLRGLAAFSREEAVRRNVPWLDLARDPVLARKLRDLLNTLEDERFRPAALAGSGIDPAVTEESAAKRWAALKSFVKEQGHFLDTNGPYVLKAWGPETATFKVLRDFKYAVGIGTFDGFADPTIARVTSLKRQGNQVWIRAELEKMVRFGRDLKVIKEPLQRGAAKGFRMIKPRARSVLIGPDGSVVAVDAPEWQQDGRFSVRLPKSLAQGSYRLLAEVVADDNSVRAGIGSLRFDMSASTASK